MLTGNRVRLRAIARMDIPKFLVWLNDPEVNQYLAGVRPITELDEERWVEGLAGNEKRVNFVIDARIEQDGWTPIGVCGLESLNFIDRSGVAGMAIGEKVHQEKRFGSEAIQLLVEYAFLQLNLHRISSTAHGFNVRSIKMQKRAGFVEEGRRRQAVYRNGTYHDSVLLGLLRSEWEELKQERG